jgi:hypothetical protein
MIDELAKRFGIPKTNVLEMAVRKLAQSEGLELPKK